MGVLLFIGVATRIALGVVVVLSRRPLTEALKVPARAVSSCFAVMPKYLLARDPAVILLGGTALVEVLVPSKVRAGRASSSSVGRVRLAAEGVRTARPGVVTAGRGRSDGVMRPEMENEACDEARERCEDATDTGREMPAVGGESFAASTNTPQSGGHAKYGTLNVSFDPSRFGVSLPVDATIVLAFPGKSTFQLDPCPYTRLELGLSNVPQRPFHTHTLHPDPVAYDRAEFFFSSRHTRSTFWSSPIRRGRCSG